MFWAIILPIFRSNGDIMLVA